MRLMRTYLYYYITTCFSVKTKQSGAIIHEIDEDEDIDLYLDTAPMGSDAGDQQSANNKVIQQQRAGTRA